MPDTAMPPTKGFFVPRRTTHVNCYVSDLDRAMQFYTTILGIEEVYRTPLVGGGFVSNGNTHHDIGFVTADGPAGKPRNAKPGTLNHLAFELETEVELVDSYKRAIASGHKFLRTADHDIAHSIYGADPDGIVYELYADVVEDWRNRRTGIVTKPKPNWVPGDTPPVTTPQYHAAPELRRVDAALFHPLRTASITLVVSDLVTSVDHYERIVGMHVISHGADGQMAVMAGADEAPSLVLIQANATRATGYHHVSMEVADPADLAASVDRARADGFEIAIDMTEAGRRAVLVRDPDGMLVQFYSDTTAPVLDALTAAVALYLL